MAVKSSLSYSVAAFAVSGDSPVSDCFTAFAQIAQLSNVLTT